MATKTKPTDAERLTALIDAKLSDMENRQAEGHPPSTAELNAVRRLTQWADGQRQVAEAREIFQNGR